MATCRNFFLVIVSLTGAKQKVTVRGDVTLDALAQKLGYTASAYALKTATEKEHELSKTVTMAALADKGESGDLLIIAYDANGKAMGAAKVVKTGTDQFTVTKTKDTNTALASYGNDSSSMSTGQDGTRGRIFEKGAASEGRIFT